MILILDGNSLRGAHVRRNICYSTCTRHLITSRAVTNRVFFNVERIFKIFFARNKRLLESWNPIFCLLNIVFPKFSFVWLFCYVCAIFFFLSCLDGIICISIVVFLTKSNPLNKKQKFKNVLQIWINKNKS